MPDPTNNAHTRWSDLPIEPMNPLLGRQFVSGSNVMVARITLSKGAHVPLHQHHNEQVACLLTGKLKFLLHHPGSDTPVETILNPDEVLVIPPNVPHEVFALEDTVNLDICSPPREDWITGDDAYLRR
jgi:quercetin dioxygenase-like cupin family protein